MVFTHFCITPSSPQPHITPFLNGWYVSGLLDIFYIIDHLLSFYIEIVVVIFILYLVNIFTFPSTLHSLPVCCWNFFVISTLHTKKRFFLGCRRNTRKFISVQRTACLYYKMAELETTKNNIGSILALKTKLKQNLHVYVFFGKTHYF